MVAAQSWAIWGQRSYFGDRMITTLVVEHVNGTSLRSMPDFLDRKLQADLSLGPWWRSPACVEAFVRLIIRVVGFFAAAHEVFLLGDCHAGNMLIRIALPSEGMQAPQFFPTWVDLGAAVEYGDMANLKAAWQTSGLATSWPSGFGMSGIQGSSDAPGPYQGQELLITHANLSDLLKELASEGRLHGILRTGADVEAAERAARLQGCAYLVDEYFERLEACAAPMAVQSR